MAKSFRQQTLLLFFSLLTAASSVVAQGYPDVPNSVQFGGINVKFDKSAKDIINSDIQSLMSNRRFWEDKMDRAILYFPIIEGILIEQEVPIDFKYLAVQESSLNPDAISSSNAVGFWQFKRETAQELGIRVDNEIDERKNISASTLAAARYVKRSNQQFNNWVSSLYSYYLGMGGVKNSIPANWANSREVTITGKTDRYVLRFFAHKIALEAGLDRHRTANTIVLLETPSNGQRTFSALAQNLNINELELRKYNRWIDSDNIPTDKEYLLVIPVSTEQINTVREKLSVARQDIAMANVKQDIGFPVLRKKSQKAVNGHDFYEINGLPGIQALAGDKPSTLAKAAKVSVAKLMRYNDQTGNEPLIPEDIYYLSQKNKKAKVPFHTVRNGETLRGVSQIYGIRLKNLLKYNRINNRNLRLQTGRVLYLTQKRPHNQPVEIIDQPTFPENQLAPIQTTAPITAATPSSDIPQNASERKKYTPKLADQNAGTSYPGKTESSTPVPSRETPVSTTPTANERIVIITEGETLKISTKDETWKETPKTVNKPAARTTVTSNSNSSFSGSAKRFHSVEAGQTYYSISRLYNISVDKLLSMNNLTANNKLSVGQKLIVNTTVEDPGQAAANFSTTEKITHLVISGETLFRISKIYNVDIDDLKRVNNLTDNTVKVGQRLLIPKN